MPLRERWLKKVARAMRERPSVGRHAQALWVNLLDGGATRGRSIKDLSKRASLPPKYMPRAMAVLVRYGLLDIRQSKSVWTWAARVPRTLKSTRIQPRARARMSRRVYEEIYHLDRGRCAASGHRVARAEAVFDHLIPFAYGGADAAANLVTSCARHNREKLDLFMSTHPRGWYRGKRIQGTIGLRWRDGAFWPFINGRLRRSLWQPPE